MSLVTPKTDKPTFEAAADEATTQTSGATAAAQPTQAATTQAATSAVAIKPAASLAVAGDMQCLDKLKGALPVEYNTLSQIIATNGNFVERETKTVMGDTIQFELLSWQDAWVVSPNDDKAPKDLVRFSDDGITCGDGTPVAEVLANLKADGYSKAALRQRVVLVGAIIAAAKTDKYNGELMQLDLSPASRTQWLRYQANAAYSIRTNRKTEAQVKTIKAEAHLAQNGDNTYTLAKFDAAPTA